ncbi:hypothetical protein MMC07_001734 [Pseudocyphellaria aurata]|nr:hypothetical protein [Pseudocyphellaria aurata]
MAAVHKTKASMKPKGLRANASSQPVQRRTSPRLRMRISNSLSSLKPPQELSNANEDQACPRRQKRPRNSEEEPSPSAEKAPPAKRARRSLLPISDNSLPLTKENLRKHTITASKQSMADSSRSNKRTSSARDNDESMASKSMRYQETVTQTSQKSSSTAAHYRHSILRRANIEFQFKSVPDEVSTAITTVVERDISSKRKKELAGIALKLHERFIHRLSLAAREDDYVELFYGALSSLGYGNLTMARKADWHIGLKPQIISLNLNLDAWFSPQGETQGSREPPNKRSQAARLFPSPEPSKETVTKHEVSGLEKGGLPHIPQAALKTPRPDISIGIDDAAVYTALQSRGLTLTQAKHLLYVLSVPNAQNDGRPSLLSEPTTAVLEMRFPFLIVEGKSYATCRTIYEAQNQAAVSGACALNILHDLSNLSNLVNNANSESLSKTTPIVFSITTEGPIHELWAHYMTMQDGDRLYQMSIIQSCHMAIRRDVFGFMETVENILKWGCGEHLKNAADQLGTFWTATQLDGNR